jgi:hypothetical protein
MTTSLYEVWVGVGEPTLSPGFGGRSSWTPSYYTDYERVQLPLSWARGYAERLAQKLQRPVEVRHSRTHRVWAVFG